MRVPIVAVTVLVLGCAARTPSTFDVNRATTAELRTIPALSAADAARIVAQRPYETKDDLVRRRVLDASTYAAAAPRLVVGPPGMPEWLEWVPRQAGSP